MLVIVTIFVVTENISRADHSPTFIKENKENKKEKGEKKSDE